MSAPSASTLPKAAEADKPYQPAFLDSLTLTREQRKGYSPLDNPQFMSPKEKMRIFFTEQPLIPIGLLVTVGFFVVGLGHFVRGKNLNNNWKYVVSHGWCHISSCLEHVKLLGGSRQGKYSIFLHFPPSDLLLLSSADIKLVESALKP